LPSDFQKVEKAPKIGQKVKGLTLTFWSILATFLKHLKYECKPLQSVFYAFGVF
jgi:hypothetical protein